MEWTDTGIVLSLRRHGETSAVVSLLTAERGRHAGLARGAFAKRLRGVLMPGNAVRATWRARTEDHLGSLLIEPMVARAGFIMDDPARLAALNSACALLDGGLMEREAHPALYRATEALFDALSAATDDWAEAYFAWELGFLAELGFGLDLSRCAGDGRTDDLGYVSPKSARAVSLEAGAPYRDRMLPLPRFLIGERGRPPANHPGTDLADAAELTGHFLERHVFTHREGGIPASRGRFVEILLREHTTSGVVR
ncbi:DNA repair protein RecO [Minwuia sp.]|uniref:DNA repair protein RecO n=1 Tax=Minwuia sp. TaxID=2493630 RepID=UPI003A90049E